MDVPAPLDPALAHPTRARLFSLLGELRRPAATDELAELLKSHPNGIRVHLGRLHAAGLITRERIRQARGRPRDMWTIAPTARPGGAPPTAYVQLGRWLARVVSAGPISRRRIEATGRSIGRELAPDGGGSPEQRLKAVLVSLGFQPQRQALPGAHLTYRLGNCPFCDAVRESPEVVCGLHRGITRGLLDAIAPDARLAAFVPGEDPRRAGCLIGFAGVRTPGASATPPLRSPRTPPPTPPAQPTSTRGRQR
jgi:predicted ArsR family transcriptional regulator